MDSNINSPNYFDTNSLGTDIKLLELHGRELITQKVIADITELNLQALPQGLYLVKVGNKVQKLTVE